MVDNEIFWEWCDTLIQCQDDRTLKDTLLPIVAKLTDVRIVNSELKTIYAVIPDNDSSYNFIVGMLYTQLFQQLYYSADVKHGGRLPVHVHFVMDEFANETQL